ncbi:MAG: alpha/beta fold hydrolase, partial [bacterium]|nr:alpha/beta fold hydrolase [bacterium]
LDYGLGGPVNTWQGIFPEIAKFTRVVQYHRAGYGRSDAPWTPYSFTVAATQLRALLQRSNIPGPYVLVGHSLGNAHIRAFAHLFPEEVAGMVLIDPVNARIFEAMSEKEKAEDEKWVKDFLLRAPPGPKAEITFLTTEDKDLKTLRAFKRPPDVPMVLLVAGRHEAGATWKRSVIEEYGPWIYEASEGALILDAESTHYIHRDNPGLVISSIRRVVFPSVSLKMERLVKDKGVEAAVSTYRALIPRYPHDYFVESHLNTLGYQRLREKDMKGAIMLFKLNVEMFPQASNPYDSLAEAYMADGQNTLAVENYRRSLELNPKNTNAAEMLKKLGVP